MTSAWSNSCVGQRWTSQSDIAVFVIVCSVNFKVDRVAFSSMLIVCLIVCLFVLSVLIVCLFWLFAFAFSLAFTYTHQYTSMHINTTHQSISNGCQWFYLFSLLLPTLCLADHAGRRLGWNHNKPCRSQTLPCTMHLLRPRTGTKRGSGYRCDLWLESDPETHPPWLPHGSSSPGSSLDPNLCGKDLRYKWET